MRNRAGILAAALAMGLVLRLGFAWHLGHDFYQLDEVGYDAVAWNFAQHGALGLKGKSPEAMGNPLMPFATGIIYKFFGHNALPARAAQAALSAATIALIAAISNLLFSHPLAAPLAAFLAAGYPFFIYYSGILMTETWFVFMLCLGVWMLMRILKTAGRGGRVWAAATGLVWGLLALTRGEGFYCGALILLGMGAACRRRGEGGWKNFALLILFWVLPWGLWGLRNQKLSGSFILDTHAGLALLHGTIAFEENEKDTTLAHRLLDTLPFYQDAQKLDAVERDRVYKREALRFMAANPGRVLRQWARKFVNFWRFFPRLDKVYHPDPHNRPNAGFSRNLLAVVSAVWELPLILLGGWGLWKARSRFTLVFPVYVFILGHMGIHIVSVSQMRYRLPVMPFLIVFAAAAAAEQIKWRSGLKAIFDFLLDRCLTSGRQESLGNHILHRLRGEGNYDPETNGEYRALRLVKHLVHEKDAVIFDVGAHTGLWSSEAVRGMSSRLVIYAFEPSGASYLKLKSLSERLGCQAIIQPVNVALSDADGAGALHIDGDLYGTNSLHERHTNMPGLRQSFTETVILKKGDSFCRQNGIGHIDFLKIDTEGHEVSVLAGFDAMLKGKKIDYIQFEYVSCWINSRRFLFEAMELLARRGYKVGRLYPGAVKFLDRYDQRDETFAFSNYFAVRSELSRTIS